MIFNKDLIFIHIGKTGGMSCSEYLLQNLKAPLFNCNRNSLNDSLRIKRVGIIPCQYIHRHCTLSEALTEIEKITDRRLTNFKKVVAVIRHPYFLEYSFYCHLKKPHVKKLRSRQAELLKLAQGTFKNFIIHGDYHRPNLKQEDYFMLEGTIPSCVELVKFEELNVAFPRAIQPFLQPNKSLSFPSLNQTKYQNYSHDIFTEEIKELIYNKHKWMFDSGLYSRDITI